MRLSEVEGSGATGFGQRRFRLYGSRRIAEWHDNPLKYNEYAPHEMAPEEMTSRLQAMVNLIAARTELVPRTLSKALQVPGEGVAPHNVRNEARRTAIYALIVGGFTLACTCTVVLLPLTTSTALNLAVAGSLVALIVALIVLRAYDRHLQLRHTQNAPTLALPPDSPTGKYKLRAGMEARSRGIIATVGVVLCVNFLPALALIAHAVLTSVGTPLQGAQPVATAGATLLTWLLCLYGLLGFVFLRMAFTGGAKAIRASDTGLSMTITNRPITLLWEQVVAISARTRQGRIIRYDVVNSDHKTIFSWSATSSRFLPPKSREDALAVTPDQLAALTSARSGKPIEMREV